MKGRFTLMNGKLMNPILDFINTLCNFIVLNLVFLITCLPVITIGTALSSLYYVTLREARGEYGYLVRPYLAEFRKNLKSGTAAFCVLFLVGAILLFNLAFWYSFGTVVTSVLAGLFIIALFLWLFVFTYTFPLIARFENTTTQTVKNAFQLMMTNVKPTIALALIYVTVITLCLFAKPMKLLMVLFGFAFIAYCQSFIFKKIFEPYEKAQERDYDL